MKEDIPKDYVIEDFEELLEKEYKNLTLFQKIVYNLQDYLLVVIPVVFLLGYLAGIRFGIFW